MGDTLKLSSFPAYRVTKCRPSLFLQVKGSRTEGNRLFISLESILQDPLFRSARPRLLAGAERVAHTQVRWVHPSEVVQIASLLHGHELLLTTAEAVFKMRTEAQRAYLQSLSDRGIAALMLEPLVADMRIPPEFIEHAEKLGLPLYRLEVTVPFVELAEKINRSIVSEQAAALQQADEISQSLAKHIASAGPGLRPLMDMIAAALEVHAALANLGGQTLAESGTPPPIGEGIEVSTDLFVGSDVAARLLLHSGQQVSRQRLEIIAERLGSIVGLAYAQHHRPSAVQLANTALLQAIVNGAGAHFIAELAQQAQIRASDPVCLMVFQSYDMSRIRSGIESILHLQLPGIRTYLESNRLYALHVLDPAGPRRSRAAAIRRLREALGGISVEGCVGPPAAGIASARRSLSEALAMESFPASGAGEGRIRDASDYALERLAVKFPEASVLQDFVREQLDGLLAVEPQRGGPLLLTLTTWLDEGCNTTATAARLYLERQTMHKRLAKIFVLLGGDPRRTGRLLGVHLACRVAIGLPSQEI